MSEKRKVFDEDEMLPLKLEIIPLYHRPIFPGVFAPILVQWKGHRVQRGL